MNAKNIAMGIKECARQNKRTQPQFWHKKGLFSMKILAGCHRIDLAYMYLPIN
jgi:hypothetical protein